MFVRQGLTKSKIFLGFEDEEITKHNVSYLCHTTNKVGGKPDWGNKEHFPHPQCLLCGLTLPLIIQIYAPLKASRFHRTLYLFGCVNPTCWNKNESWVCLRRQLLDTSLTELSNDVTIVHFDWCEGADDWVAVEMDNTNENPNDPFFDSGQFIREMAELDVNKKDNADSHSTPETNQNSFFSLATAELDDEQRDPVTVDTLLPAQVDLPSIYQQVKPVPKVSPESLQFLSFFISVGEEKEEEPSDVTNYSYKFNINGVIIDEEPNSMINQQNVAAGQVNNDEPDEKYEKTLPAHGDKLFHNLISRIQRNPGQLLRYIRDGGTPLFLYPAENVPQHCQHCNGDLVYELQVLPTVISRLQLLGSGTGHIEFGTVFILACKQSCWNSQDIVRSEYVLVQREL